MKELRELLDEADYVEGEDTVVLVGDLVDKGPYPLEVPRPCTPPAHHCLPLIGVSDLGQRLCMRCCAFGLCRPKHIICKCFLSHLPP